MDHAEMHSNRRASRVGGFTLIELMIVVALIALISAVTLPSLSSQMRISMNSATRELAGLIKETYNASQMTGKVHRIAYDLKKQEFWVESGPLGTLLETEESRTKAERRRRFMKEEDIEKEANSSGFALDKAITRKKLSLPRGVEFIDLTTEADLQNPIKTGMAYTHFFPHGLAEQTVIHLTDSSKNKSTLVISAVLGRTRLISGEVLAKNALEGKDQ